MPTIRGLEEFERKLKTLDLAVQRNGLTKAVKAGAEMIRAKSSENVRSEGLVLTGTLEEQEIVSIAVSLSNAFFVVARIGPSSEAFYGCVFDSHTYISMEKGQKQIGCIKVGDCVLTQTGEFRKVLAVMRYPATEKPDLITIVARYRAGQKHTLTLTRDHKILVFRDGRHMWIPAGDLTLTDFLLRRTKKSWSVGTARIKICQECFGSYSKKKGLGQGDQYCSRECVNKAVARKNTGSKRSAITKTNIRDATRRRFAERPETHPNRIMAKRGFITNAEKVIDTWLLKRGLMFQKQFPVGQVFADFFVPEVKTIYEADGAYWHQNQARDIERDKYILSQMPDVQIIHVHFFDARFSPLLEENPLPGVFYVACNPGPKSYVEPTVFETTEILSLTPWHYEQKSSRPAYLYDLTVEGIHSFVASGIIISNSFGEHGTIFQAETPFLEPAWESEMSAAVDAAGMVLKEIVESVR